MKTTIELDAPQAYWTRTYSVWRHEPLFCQPGRYAVVTQNTELARMQGANKIHPACVVDDFGDLVRVPA